VAEPAHSHSAQGLPLWASMPSCDRAGMLLAGRPQQVECVPREIRFYGYAYFMAVKQGVEGCTWRMRRVAGMGTHSLGS